MGMKIGTGSKLPFMQVTWPHQVALGQHCHLEHGIYFKYDGIWQEGPSIIIRDKVFIGANCEFNITKRIEIGKGSLIASGCKFIDHNHSKNIDFQLQKARDEEAEIIIGNYVWLGANVIILMGVKIADRAIIAAGAVVNKSIPANEIWGGVPARKIGIRK